MKTDIHKIASLAKFLTIKNSIKTKTVINLEKPSRILLQNIYCSWLKSIYNKTAQHFPVYLDKDAALKSQKICYGYIKPQSINVNEVLLEDSDDNYKPNNSVELKLNLVMPQQDVMQCFIQWQRYRKYWWSSITTTPSLFSVNDMKHGAESADINIVANFNWGPQIVETISINGNGSENNNNNSTKTSSVTCVLGLETALLTLLLDGITNATKEEYLRLHNRMAPYKISFALDSEDKKIEDTLKELAQLIFIKLGKKKISSLLPTFKLPLQLQIKENLHMGITYTAILSESTLSNGIFHLLNSNTMLKEQVHIADFDSYAALLCGKHNVTI